MSGRIRVLNVGQGDAVLLHHPELGTAAVVDCAFRGARSARRYLRDEGVDELLGVVVTHLDADHYGGVFDLLENIEPPPRVLAYGLVKGFKEAHTKLNTFMRQMDSYGSKYKAAYLEPEDGKHIGSPSVGVHLQFLGPNGNEKRRAVQRNDANIASSIIRATVGDLTAILPGDAPPWRWDRLVDTISPDLRADVLLLPHHGGPHQGGGVGLADLLDAVDPAVIAISVGSKNSHEHPALSTLDIAGEWARRHDRNLLCTQLNCACESDGTVNGKLPSGLACARDITIEHDGSRVIASAGRTEHRDYTRGLVAPRCLLT